MVHFAEKYSRSAFMGETSAYMGMFRREQPRVAAPDLFSFHIFNEILY